MYTVLATVWPPVREKIIARPVKIVNTASIARKIKAHVEYVSSGDFSCLEEHITGSVRLKR